jgi:hypothetical protein
MTKFSENQTHRPLFEEPTLDIERVDPSEGPLGFMIGGMANLPLEYLGQQYFDAASVLAERIRNGAWEDYRLANPTLFLYRHSIELLLKAAMGATAKTHSLDKLTDQFVEFVRREYGEDVPGWIIGRMKELAKIDPNSTAFRYSRNYDKATKQDTPVDGEFHVDLLHLQNAMNALNAALVGVIAGCASGKWK